MSVASEVTIRTLSCHADAEIAAEAMASLCLYSPVPVRVIVHDDGTLMQQDIDRLRARVPGVEFLPRVDADERVDAALARYPASRAYREKCPHGLKLFDVVLLSVEEQVNFCDSDVVFLRPFDGLFALPSGVGGVFHPNETQSYSVYSWQLLRERNLGLLSGLSSGLFSFARGGFDFDLVEWFLGRGDFRLAPEWREQTAWGLLAYKVGAWLWDEKRVLNAAPKQDLSRAVAVHYVRSRRGLLYSAPPPRFPADGPRIRVEAHPSRRCTAFDLGHAELRRRVARFGVRGQQCWFSFFAKFGR